jgi:hypothetical protein
MKHHHFPLLKKLCLFVFSAFLTIASVSAQHAANYAFTTDTSASLTKDLNGNNIDMSSGTTLLVDRGLDSRSSAVTGIGFTYFLMGLPFTQFSVQDDGIIQLGDRAIAVNNVDLTFTVATSPFLSAFCADMRTGFITGKIHSKVAGTAPQRVLVIEFKDMQLFYNAWTEGTSTFQVRLYENGTIEYVYGPMSVTSIVAASRNPSIGFYTAPTPGGFACVSYSTHTVTTSGTFTPNGAIAATGPIPELTTYSDTTRRSYRLTPKRVPAAPVNLTFSNVTSSSITANWTDNDSIETGYHVYGSFDNGFSYTLLATLPANVNTYTISGLLPDTPYHWKIFAYNEGGISDTLRGSRSTLPSALIKSTSAGGNWSDPATWVNGTVPVVGDSVVIADSATVTIDTDTASCYALTVGEGSGGVLTYTQAKKGVLTVVNNVYVTAHGRFTAGTGNLLTHVLNIGGKSATAPGEGSLTVNGVLDMYTTDAVVVNFFGNRNAAIQGTPDTLDFSYINVNKGNSMTTKPVLSILAEFTVQGTETTGLIGTHTGGIIRIGGTFTRSNPIYTTASYSIPLNGGLHLDNPNFTITGTNGNPIVYGLLRVSRGVFMTGQANNQKLLFSTGAVFTVDGGVVIAASAINSSFPFTFNFSSGTIQVATVGNNVNNLASFGITHASSTVNWSGGTLMFAKRSTGATQVDYAVSSAIPAGGSGLLRIGGPTTPANTTFFVNGYVPDMMIDSTQTATLLTQLTASGTITVQATGTLKQNGQHVFQVGNAVVNHGFIDGRTGGTWYFAESASGHTYSGTGIDTLYRIITQDTNAIVLNKPVTVLTAISFNGRAPITNSYNLTLGNGLAPIFLVQVGTPGYTKGNVGIFDTYPVYKLGTGSYNIHYLQEGSLRTTGLELPPSRTIGSIVISNPEHVALSGGPLNVNTINLASGRLITTTSNLLRVINPVAGAMIAGSVQSYVDGPLQRTIAQGITAPSTYIFYIGKGSSYRRTELVNPKTNTGGTTDIMIESFTGQPSGSADNNTIDTLLTGYWDVKVTGGNTNIDSAYLRFYDNTLTPLHKMAYADSAGGVFRRVSNLPANGTITTYRLTGDTGITGVFATGLFRNPLSGTYLVGAGKTAPNYPSLTAAMADLTERQVQGNVSLLLDTDYSSALETFPIVFPPFIADNPAHTITIKPNTGVSATITGNNAQMLLRFANGARNYVLDGSNNGSSRRDLFIHNTNTFGGTVVFFQGTAVNQGVQNTQFKNTIIKGGNSQASYGVVAGSNVSLTANGIGHNNLLIENNIIYNCLNAVVLSGTSATQQVKGITVANNIIGTDTSSFYNRRHGIFLYAADSVMISHNTLKNITTNTSGIAGISINENTTNSVITGNSIRGLYCTSTSGGAYGLVIASNTGVSNITVSNNAISDIQSTAPVSGVTGPFNAFGIRIAGGSDIKLYFNTVHLFGQAPTASANYSGALYIATAGLSGFDIRNNIFSNSMTGANAASRYYAFVCATPFTTTAFDYNNFAANSPQGILMYKDVAPNQVNTIADLRIATGANVHSMSIDPQFTAPDNLVTGLGPLSGMGQHIPGITMDIDDSTRANPPAIGAYERQRDISGPAIAYSTTGKYFVGTGQPLPDFATITDYSGVDTVTKPRIYYRKSYEANVFGTYPANNNAAFNGWKYAEATYTDSVFSFTVDYTKLTSGNIAAWDTIVYFIIAKDIAGNISSNPSTGFGAARLDSIITAPAIPNRYVIYDLPLAGTYNVGSAYTYPHFTTIGSAISALHSRGVSAPVVLELTDPLYAAPSEIFPLTFNEIAGTGPGSTVTLKPAPGKNVRIIGTSASGLINVNGTDHLIIDGSNNGSSSQDLFIQNTNVSTAAIMYQGSAIDRGAESCILRNTVVKGGSNSTSYGVFIGGTTLGLSSNGTGHKGLRVNNNTIYNTRDAIVIAGTSSIAKVTGVTIRDNMIGTDSAAFYNTRNGIHTMNADSITLHGNIIRNVKGPTVSNAGITIFNYTTNTTVSANRISGVHSGTTATAPGATGILVSTFTDQVLMVNNIISDIRALVLSSVNASVGIRIAGNNTRLYHNTVHMYGQAASGILTSSSALLLQATNLPGLDMRNNIFSNSMTSPNAASKHYALWMPAGTPAIAPSLFDYNDYITSGNQGVLALRQSDDVRTLAELKTITNANANSVSIDPQFTNDSNLAVGYGALTGLGTTLAEVTTDIENNVRDTPPAPGAYQLNADITGPAIVFTPLTKNSELTSRTLNAFATITDYSKVDTATSKRPRIYFKKSGDAPVFGSYPANNNAAFNGWKYVEATNTASPFSFAIDYSLLTSGGVSLWDTIEYFVVAKDVSSSQYVSARPAPGFMCVSIDSVTQAPYRPERYVIYDAPLAGTYSVGSAHTYPNFPTINAAVSALHVRGVSAPVVLELTDAQYNFNTESFPVTINEIEGAGPSSTITLKPAAGMKVILAASVGTGVITLNGTDYFIIDGSNNGTQSQDLFIQNLYPSGAGVMFQGSAANQGSEHSVIRNTVIKGYSSFNGYGVFAGGTTLDLVTNGIGHRNLLIENNTIYNCANGVVVAGQTAISKVAGVTVRSNTIGSDSALLFVGRNGIYVVHADSVVLTRNNIKNIRSTNSNITLSGIALASNVRNTRVTLNTIRNIYATGSTGVVASGINMLPNIAGADNILISNNSVSNINAYYGSLAISGSTPAGIRIGQGNDIKVYHNTVHLFGQTAVSAATSSSALNIFVGSGTVTNLDIRNNIFSNRATGTNAGSKHHALSYQAPLPSSVFDYNDFVVAGSQGVLTASGSGTTVNYTPTLDAFKTLTGTNTNSVSIDPVFVNDSLLVPNLGTVTGKGIALAAVTTDIRDSIRSTPPTIGAYENAVDMISPEIVYTALGNTTQLSGRTFNVTITDYSGIDTSTFKPRVYFRKSTNADVFGSYPADNNASFNGWKYAEATNTASPFTFSIDHSLLSGSVSIWDTIMYFVTAQDLNIPANISAKPGAGFAANTVNAITKAPDMPNRYILYDLPLSGTYHIGASYAYPDFATLTDASTALGTRGVSGPVTMLLEDEVYETPEITIEQIPGSSEINQVTLKPAAGKKVVITGNTPSALISLNGTDHITIDGSNNGSASQDLHISNVYPSGTGIWFIGTAANQGVQYSVLRNTIVRGTSNVGAKGLLIGGTTQAVPSNGIGHNNLLIENNTVYNCAFPIVISGMSQSTKVRGVTLLNNTIGTDSAGLFNTIMGIYVANTDSVTISRNTINKVYSITSGSSANGIYLGENTTRCNITGNTLRDVYAVSGGSYGINIQSAAVEDITISNNSISGIRGNNNSFSSVTATNVSGIRIMGGSSVKLYFNSVHLSTPEETMPVTVSSAALLIVASSMPGLDIRNNIFSNSITSTSAGAKQYALICRSPFPASVFNYNNFTTNGPQGALMLAQNTSALTSYNTMVTLRAVTNNNDSSVSINPHFISDTLLIPNLGTVEGLGENIPGITHDIRDSLRMARPTMGAYENGTDNLTPQITYTPLANTTQLSGRTLTDFATITDYSGINTTTAKPRLYFKKVSENNVFSHAPSDNASSFNGWKYAEATNTVSPFSFTIDYALLTGGGITLWDTIEYFVAAQDNFDTSHVSANPSYGFAAGSLHTITKAPDTTNRYILIAPPLAGNYFVGSAHSSPDFTTITEAVKVLNLSGISAPVTFQLTDAVYSSATEILPFTINEITGSSALNTVTMKPAAGNKATITGSVYAHGIINFNGTAHFILDGSGNGTSSRDMFIENTHLGRGAVVTYQGTESTQGSQNCVLKNTILKGASKEYYYYASGLIIGEPILYTPTVKGFRNITVENNLIYNCANAVTVKGASGSKVTGLHLSGNTLGTDTVLKSIGEAGIYLGHTDSFTIERNIIQNVQGNYVSNNGISIAGNTTNGKISGNTIKGISAFPTDPSFEYGGSGIRVNNGSNISNIEFVNNAIMGVITTDLSSTITNQFRTFGIKLEGGSNLRFYFNSVHLSGELERGSSASMYVAPGSTTGLDIRNNIFSNVMTQGIRQLGNSYAMYLASPLPQAQFDYNNFYVSGSFTYLMYTSSYLVSTLAELKTQTNANAHSVSVNPGFANDYNLAVSRNTVQGLGIAIPGITHDITDSLRADPPTIGAYEKGIDISGPKISYAPLENIKSLVNRPLPSFATITDFTAVDTLSGKPRLYYRKSTNANVFGTYPANNNASFNGWKYVEATNTSSPFSFTIDYARVAGGVAELDTIVYFVVAQDVNVPVNVSASPAAGFAASGINTVTSAPSAPHSYMIEYVPLAGNYLIGAAQNAPNFKTITAAVNALHLKGMTDSVVFHLTDGVYTSPAETFPITINEFPKSDYDATVTFKPAAGVSKVVITGSATGNGLFNINGTKHLIIDGSNNGTSSQNLFIRNTASGGYGVWFQGDETNFGAMYSALKNTIVKGGSNTGSFGVIVGGTYTSFTHGGTAVGGIGKGGIGHFDLSVHNNTIYNCRDAVVVAGTSMYSQVGGLIKITGNTIGTDSAGLLNTRNGIYLAYISNILVSKNTIKNVKTTAANSNATGISINDYVQDAAISGNIISGIHSTNINGGGAYGISLNPPAGQQLMIANNVISDIMTSNYSVSPFIDKNAYGIRVVTGAFLKMYFNTVHLYGQPTAGNNPSASAALLIADRTGSGSFYPFDIRNNIFSNSMTGKIAGSKHYALSISSIPIFNPDYIFNYNNFVANSSHGVLMADSSLSPSVDVTSMLTLQTSTANMSSTNIDPRFVSNTDLRIGPGTLQGLGTYIADVTRDIADSLRLVPPTMGAYENVPGIVPVSLLSFAAQAQSNNVDLHWTTASETNNKGFEVERSADGRHFENIQFVEGNGTSSSRHRYTLTDANAFAAASVLYYRLKQVDFDGQYAYSPVVKVSKATTQANSISAYPNPYTNSYTVSFTAASAGTVHIEMTDMQSKVAATHTTEAVPGTNAVEVPENNLQPGVYIVRLTINGESHVLKLVKN